MTRIETRLHWKPKNDAYLKGLGIVRVSGVTHVAAVFHEWMRTACAYKMARPTLTWQDQTERQMVRRLAPRGTIVTCLWCRVKQNNDTY